MRTEPVSAASLTTLTTKLPDVKELFKTLSSGSGGSAFIGDEILIFLGADHTELAFHESVGITAKLRTINQISSIGRGLKPNWNDHSRNRILRDPEGIDLKGMNDILGTD